MPFDPAERAAQISTQVREALRKALPAPAEQFFTVMVPGKVVNLSEYAEGFDDKGNLTNPILPIETERKQAVLCDDMPALAPVQLGPTGKSVARSYSAAISKLIPTGTTVGVDAADPKNLSEEEARYRRAMDWLQFVDPKQGGHKSRIELYTDKQKKYTEAVEAKTKAFSTALQDAMNDPRNNGRAAQTAAYEKWVNENARTYRNFVQAAYMDWVVSGNKEEVEYWFSVVDRDTAMSRVEASKEAMRAAVVQDSDGSVEYNKVSLTPSHWAVLAKNKISSPNKARTAEWYRWEISRLKKMNVMLDALKDKQASEVPAPPVVTVDTTQLKTLTADFITKRNLWQQALGDNKKTQDQRDAAATAYQTALDALKKEQAKHDASTVQGSIDANQTAKSKLYAELVGAQGWAVKAVARNNDTIKEYEAEIAKLGVKGGGDPHDAYVDELATSANIPESQKDPAAAANPDEDYFTSIQLRIASKSSKETKSASSSKASFGASIGWGWWKVEANAQSSESSAAMSKAMSDNEVTIKFECMRVDIQRSWLRGELFYDSDLDAAQGDAISPGFSRLKELMEGGKAGDEKELQRYSQFPFYPTAFLLATNVTLEIKGETSEIQSRFSQSSSSGDAGFNYGPFISVGGSASKSSESSDSSCTATSDGCRIEIKSPQIIGWISQLVPALPRLKD